MPPSVHWRIGGMRGVQRGIGKCCWYVAGAFVLSVLPLETNLPLKGRWLLLPATRYPGHRRGAETAPSSKSVAPAVVHQPVPVMVPVSAHLGQVSTAGCTYLCTSGRPVGPASKTGKRNWSSAPRSGSDMDRRVLVYKTDRR